MQLTPGQVQQRLYDVDRELSAAAARLRTARDQEVHAREALTLAIARATLSEECPKPRRGENGVTVADKQAWVDLAVKDERFTLAVAEATRQAAWDAFQVTQGQASLVQSLSALMRTEMNLAGAQPG